jgi:hypothetical protein
MGTGAVGSRLGSQRWELGDGRIRDGVLGSALCYSTSTNMRTLTISMASNLTMVNPMVAAP